ncbi:MAG: aminodeoxychorismate/anthranilate synthase component II [Candidatus Omnitrophica bacterium]|nr:aminodeoxychorismate/anthranilate synthase component II [Candidatus Omnitrophota bacterium]
MILVIDNYDSFTYNLVQYLGELGADLEIYRNDKISVDEIKRMKPEKMVISPGPGEPKNAGISEDLIRRLGEEIPVFGTCLGHQAIGEVFGGRIVRAKNIMHGKTSLIYHNGKEIFKGVKNPFEATRYHSLVVERKSFPKVLTITAETMDKDKEIMALRHKKFPIWGVQFHPESILTSEGKRILKNFLEL